MAPSALPSLFLRQLLGCVARAQSPQRQAQRCPPSTLPTLQTLSNPQHNLRACHGIAKHTLMEQNMQHEDNQLASVDQRIQWVLSHPDMSAWLKASLASARQREPVAVLNDLEILDCLLRAWCNESQTSL